MPDPSLRLLPALVVRIFVGILGNKWYTAKLRKAGFTSAGTIEAGNAGNALDTFRSNDYRAAGKYHE